MRAHKYIILFITLLHLSFFASADYKDLFEHKTILITGGTGFIGRELLQEIIKYNPEKIIIFSRDEVKHAKLLENFTNNKKVISIIGDIRKYESILKASRDVDILIHAAALKRIDILEYNVFESIYTNLLGTLNIVNACLENHVKTALLISTDKACSPVNTYGGCKFIAEKLFTNNSLLTSTRFLVVRYGNVMQSTGSVIPYFCEKIKQKQSIPLTSEKMTRFFITKEQAIEHIFKALKNGTGGEIFVPKIPSFKIVDLIEYLQKKMNGKTTINIIGIRPGEKIHEIMINTTEIPRTYLYEDMYIIQPTIMNNNNALYLKHGKKLSLDEFSEYSSADSLISVDQLTSFLDKKVIPLN